MSDNHQNIFDVDYVVPAVCEKLEDLLIEAESARSATIAKCKKELKPEFLFDKVIIADNKKTYSQHKPLEEGKGLI